MKATIKAAMQAGVEVDKEKFISECCLNFGAGRRYIIEYLKDLINSDFIVEKDGKLYTPEALKIDTLLDNSQSASNQGSAAQQGGTEDNTSKGEPMTTLTAAQPEKK